MQSKVFLTVFFLCLGFLARGQNIYSALHHDRREEIKGKVVTQIKEENTFYHSTGKTIDKNSKKLNQHNLVLVEERFGEDGKIKARLTYEYDSTGLRSLWRKFERWNNIGYTVETAFYEYNSQGFLIRTTDKDSQGQVIQQSVLENNEKGHPIQLQLFDGNGNSYGWEFAQYNYEKNKSYTEVKSNDGRIISSSTLTIEFNKSETPEPGEEYNQKGDLIRTPDSVREYIYDEFGNWTTLKMFKLEKGKKKKDRIFKRKIIYSE